MNNENVTSGNNTDVPKLQPVVGEMSEQIATQLRTLTQQATLAYESEVNDLIQQNSQDQQQIEYVLERLLSFCYDETMLQFYKQLCRHLYSFNPQAAAEHVYAYREMWDSEHEVNHD